MGNIYLIRHGQASAGAQDYDELSPLGRRQAEILGHHLACQKVDFDRCISGSLKRQVQTAAIALGQLRTAGRNSPVVETATAFNEIDLDRLLRAYPPDRLTSEETPSFSAPSPTQLQRRLSRALERWIAGSSGNEQLETWESFRKRIQDGLTHLIRESGPDGRIAIFTSGGPITTLYHLIVGIPAPEAFKLAWQIANTSFSQLSFDNGKVILTDFNSHAHFKLQGMTELITYI